MNVYEISINLDAIQDNRVSLGVRVIDVKMYDSLLYNNIRLSENDDKVMLTNKCLIDTKSGVYGRELCALDEKTFLEEVCYGFPDIFKFLNTELFQLHEKFVFPDLILERMCLTKPPSLNQDQPYNRIKINISKSKTALSTIERKLILPKSPLYIFHRQV